MGTAAKPTRGNRTITVDFRDEATYFHLLGDGKAFLDTFFSSPPSFFPIPCWDKGLEANPCNRCHTHL